MVSRYVGPQRFTVLEDYISQERIEQVDEYGRRPLITTRNGRPTGDTIYSWVN